MELMAVVAVAAIVTAFALPSFQTMQINGRISSVSGELVSAIREARNTALTARYPTVLLQGPGVSSSDVTAVAVAGSWMSGWRMTILKPPLATWPTGVAVWQQISRNLRSMVTDQLTGTQSVQVNVYNNGLVNATTGVVTTGGAAALLNGFGFSNFGQLIKADGSTPMGNQILVTICAPNVTNERGRVLVISPQGQITNLVINNPAC
jgi:Tfp pilus assembly protein FimT